MKICFSYSSLDFEDFLLLLFFFFSFFSLRCNRATLVFASVAKEYEGGHYLVNRMSLSLFPIVYHDFQLIKSTIISSQKKKKKKVRQWLSPILLVRNTISHRVS